VLASTAVVGTRSEAFTLPVAFHRARAYALATDDPNPVYETGAYAPPLFGTVLTGFAVFDLYRKLFPGSALKSIHLGSDIHFHQPLVPGRQVTARGTAIGLRPSPSGALLHMLIAITDERCQPVLDMYETVLLPDVRDAPEDGELPPETRLPALRRSRTEVRREVAIAGDLALRYSAASGDWQQIHLDDDAARAVGLSRAIVHGFCTMALCATTVTDLVADGDPARLARFAARFSSPVFPGSRLVIELSEPVELDGRRCHAVRAECDGRPAIRGGRADVWPRGVRP